MRKALLLQIVLLFASLGLLAETAYEQSIDLGDGFSILHTKATTEREGEYLHRILLKKPSDDPVLIWENDFKRHQGSREYSQLSRLITGVKKDKSIRVITDWNKDYFGMWNLEIANDSVAMRKGVIIKFLDARRGIRTMKDSYTLGRADVDEVMQNKAILARGMTELKEIYFSDFDTIEVLWNDGDKDIVHLNSEGMVQSVINAKEKIPAVDGVTRDWSPGPPITLSPSTMPDYYLDQSSPKVQTSSMQIKDETDMFASQRVSNQTSQVSITETTKKPIFPWFFAVVGLILLAVIAAVGFKVLGKSS